MALPSSSSRGAACVVGREALGLRAAGRGEFAGLPQAAVEAGDQFAEAFQHVGAAERERGIDADVHAFQCFPVGGLRGQHRRCDAALAARLDHRRMQCGQRAIVAGFTFADDAAHAQAVTDRNRRRRRAFFQGDEEGVGGFGVAVATVLHEEAAEAVDEGAGDDAFDGDGLTIERTACAFTLHLADGNDAFLRRGCAGRQREGGEQGKGEQRAGRRHRGQPGKRGGKGKRIG